MLAEYMAPKPTKSPDKPDQTGLETAAVPEETGELQVITSKKAKKSSAIIKEKPLGKKAKKKSFAVIKEQTLN